MGQLFKIQLFSLFYFYRFFLYGIKGIYMLYVTTLKLPNNMAKYYSNTMKQA